MNVLLLYTKFKFYAFLARSTSNECIIGRPNPPVFYISKIIDQTLIRYRVV